MKLRISEIFGPTIQGEGALIGEPTVFIRAGGCDYRCAWCDSLHAVDSAYRHTWTAMTPEEIWDRVTGLSGGKPLMISLSGGNPAIQDFGPVIKLGKAQHYRFACETQGSVAKPWFQLLDTLVLSPKPPSSGEVVDWAAFDTCLLMAADGPRPVIKIVIFDEDDYSWARQAAERHPDLPLYLQPGNPIVDPEISLNLSDQIERLKWLVDKTTGDCWFRPRILPQLHVLMWGNERGV